MLSSDTFYLCRFLHTAEHLEEEAIGEELHVVCGWSATLPDAAATGGNFTLG